MFSLKFSLKLLAEIALKLGSSGVMLVIKVSATLFTLIFK